MGPQSVGNTTCGTGGRRQVTELPQNPRETDLHFSESEMLSAMRCTIILCTIKKKNTADYEGKTLLIVRNVPGPEMLGCESVHFRVGEK